MKKEINCIREKLYNTLAGEPWFGRSVYDLLDEVDEKLACLRPAEDTHSLVELLYHIITWTDFTLKRMEKEEIKDMDAFEQLDWREVNPEIHTWKKGVEEFKSLNKKIIALLNKKEDTWLTEKVDYRKYDYRYLLEGLIQHNIYHTGQIVQLAKIVSG